MSQSDTMRQSAPSSGTGSSGTMGAPGPRGGMETGSGTSGGGAGTMSSPPGPAAAGR